MKILKNVDPNVRKQLFIIIIVSVIIRAFIAGHIELGNDEVYYWTYALFPDWSHFDHPPMVGLTIQLFTLNLTFPSEFFIRLGAIVFSVINTLLVFTIAKKAKSEIAGLYAAFLYNTSAYCSIIAGMFILPDSPMLFFYLLAEYFLINSILSIQYNAKEKRNYLFAGIAIGLAILSKYHAVFLWSGVFIYCFFYARKYFTKKETYISIALSLICIIPILYWNYKSNFISFTFHNARVSGSSRFRIDYLASELFGSFIYNNPVNIVIIISAIIAIIKKKVFMNSSILKLGLAISLPMILTFVGFSFFNRTLPHWSGPGFTNLIIIAGAYLASKYEDRISIKKIYYPISLKIAGGLIISVLLLAYAQINYGIINIPSENNNRDLGNNDVTLDMYGWKSFENEFKKFAETDKDIFFGNQIPTIVSYRWFPSANLDYYVATPLNMKLIAFGDLTEIHKYAWINKRRGYIQKGDRAYFITNSRDYRDPNKFLENSFEKIIPADTIPIYRGGKIAEYYTIFKLYNFLGKPENPL